MAWAYRRGIELRFNPVKPIDNATSRNAQEHQIDQPQESPDCRTYPYTAPIALTPAGEAAW